MTNSLLIYEESGYLFNDTTKRLEWFEIDKEIFMLPENKNKTFILGHERQDVIC